MNDEEYGAKNYPAQNTFPIVMKKIRHHINNTYEITGPSVLKQELPIEAFCLRAKFRFFIFHGFVLGSLIDLTYYRIAKNLLNLPISQKSQFRRPYPQAAT